LNKLATNVPSKWRMASITPDHAMILRDRANPPEWNFRERHEPRASLDRIKNGKERPQPRPGKSEITNRLSSRGFPLTRMTYHIKATK
jgi:hypothetical protein